MPSIVLRPLLLLLTLDMGAGDSRSAGVSAASSAQQTKESEQKNDQATHPYLEQPLKELVKRIPELKGISPAADQQNLAMILRRTGATVDEFFANIVDLVAQEEIIQEGLGSTTVNGGMPGGLAGSKTRARYSYLILRQISGSHAEVNEFRINNKGTWIHDIVPGKGFLMTSGFALSSVHFSTLLQWDSRFLHLGDQQIDGKDTYVIAFAQIPSEAHNTVALKSEGGKLNLFVQGIAWVEKTHFQILQMRTDLLAPNPDIGLLEQTTNIAFREVRFQDVAVPLWLPQQVSVYMKFASGAGLKSSGTSTATPTIAAIELPQEC